ncbi:MAG: heparin lyase I family protein, partial [Bacteroidota bacterium]
QDVKDLLDGNSGWTGTNITDSANSIQIDSTFARTGQRSLRFLARGTTPDLPLSKCSLFNQAIEYEEGETVEISSWFYLEGTSWENGWVFLLDLEERVPVGAQPGTRLALTQEPGNPLITEFKYHQSSIVQQAALQRSFPLNEWVEIRWIVRLSQGQSGAIEVWQNQNLLMQAEGIQTLPKDQIYAIQGTRGVYNSIEVGITANADSEEKVLYLDDFLIQKLN